jgi:hypothetical protein
MSYTDSTAVISRIEDIANGIIDTVAYRATILRMADNVYVKHLPAELLDLVVVDVPIEYCGIITLPCDVHRLLRVLYRKYIVMWAHKNGKIYAPNGVSGVVQIVYYRFPTMINNGYSYPIEMIDMVAYSVVVDLLLPMTFTNPNLVPIRAEYANKKVAAYSEFMQSAVRQTITDIEENNRAQTSSDIYGRDLLP